MTSNKEKYRLICEKEDSIPIFSKYWWMDTVCKNNNWDVILIEKGEGIVASMPYMIKENFDCKYIMQPPLTQTNGIWIKYPKGQKYANKLIYERLLIGDIISEIEKLNIDYYSQKFNYRFTNWLPFYWNKYNQTTRYTYRIDHRKENIFEDFILTLKQNIRKAERLVKVHEDNLPIDEFYKLNSMVFERQNKTNPYSYDLVKVLDEACKKYNSRKIFYAVDLEDNIHAAIYLVYDKETVYYIMSGSNPDLRNSQALSLLLYEGIKFAIENCKTFDFEGSMIRPVEKFFSSYGGEQVQYFQISKEFNEKGKKLVDMMNKGIYI